MRPNGVGFPSSHGRSVNEIKNCAFLPSSNNVYRVSLKKLCSQVSQRSRILLRSCTLPSVHPRGPVQHLTEGQKIKITSLQQIGVNALAIARICSPTTPVCPSLPFRNASSHTKKNRCCSHEEADHVRVRIPPLSGLLLQLILSSCSDNRRQLMRYQSVFFSNSRLTNYYHFCKSNGIAWSTISSSSSGAPFRFGVK
jgi:hypothetical protein